MGLGKYSDVPVRLPVGRAATGAIRGWGGKNLVTARALDSNGGFTGTAGSTTQ